MGAYVIMPLLISCMVKLKSVESITNLYDFSESTERVLKIIEATIIATQDANVIEDTNH